MQSAISCDYLIKAAAMFSLNWITILNILLLTIILVASLSIPDVAEGEAMFIEDEDYNRKIKKLQISKLSSNFIHSDSRMFQLDSHL